MNRKLIVLLLVLLLALALASVSDQATGQGPTSPIGRPTATNIPTTTPQPTTPARNDPSGQHWLFFPLIHSED